MNEAKDVLRIVGIILLVSLCPGCCIPLVLAAAELPSASSAFFQASGDGDKVAVIVAIGYSSSS